ncbi:MAG: hypothetical protein ACRCSE_07570 [Vibrio sp.]
MFDLVFLIWKDARVSTNELHGVVVIDEAELTKMVLEKFENHTGLKASHIELRAMTNDSDEIFTGIPRITFQAKN